MITLLSPAKKQDFNDCLLDVEFTKPQAGKHIKELVAELKKYKPAQIKRLMSVSDNLAKLNYERYQRFEPGRFNVNNAKQAVFAFKGDAYQSLNVMDFKQAELDFMQEHLLILSGLYGYLRPLDLIQPYRLEMKTKLKNPRANDLYGYWGDTITKAIQKQLESHQRKTIVNLASKEYFQAIQLKKLDAKVVEVQFKELKNGQYKVVGMLAKRARGLMARYIMKHKIDTLVKLKQFKEAGYHYHESFSSADTLVFVR